MYFLRCLGCGAEYGDDGVRVACSNDHAPALLRTVYAERRFIPDSSKPGIARYRSWLPARNEIPRRFPRTAVFKSAALCDALRAPNLWIAFNGYWPQRGALMPTATFKDLETAAVLSRFKGNGRILLAASAGNTAAALASAASAYGVNAAIVVPQNALPKLRFAEPLDRCVRIIAVPGDAAYDDAIALAKSIAASDPRYLFEGGAANVARRDGIGTTMLSVVEALGKLPDYFVQAIGSGAGAIAAHETSLRIREDGRFGSALPKLLLAQNAPSAPVFESWRRRSRTLLGYAETAQAARDRARALVAPVLSTQRPPYEILGGLYDVLTESDGEVCIADNSQARSAAQLFQSLEGIVLEPAASVALAGLISSLQSELLARNAEIVLHVTGGGSVPNARYTPAHIESAA